MTAQPPLVPPSTSAHDLEAGGEGEHCTLPSSEQQPPPVLTPPHTKGTLHSPFFFCASRQNRFDDGVAIQMTVGKEGGQKSWKKPTPCFACPVCATRIYFLWRALTSPPPASSSRLEPTHSLATVVPIAGRGELCHVVSAGGRKSPVRGWVSTPVESVWPSHQVQTTCLIALETHSHIEFGTHSTHRTHLLHPSHPPQNLPTPTGKRARSRLSATPDFGGPSAVCRCRRCRHIPHL